MLETTPGIRAFINDEKLFFTFFVTVIFIWMISIIVLISARLVRKNFKSIIPEYDPPKDISPVFARFILVSGREGGRVGEISQKGNQLLTLISLFEKGLLTKLKMINEFAIEYEIFEDYKNASCAEEEKKFLGRLEKEIGMSGRLEERGESENQIDGYSNMKSLWFDFWNKDLYQIALSRGYLLKQGRLSILLSLFAASLTFGVFFSVFLSFIPVVGKFISAVLLFPLLIVFGIIYKLIAFISGQMDFSWILNSNTQSAILIFSILSWFAWFMILGQNMSKLNNRLTPKGLELVRRLQGYKVYLKTVDKDRLSFSFNRETDLLKTHTSFSWLGIFGMVKDKHWDQWYKIAKPKD